MNRELVLREVRPDDLDALACLEVESFGRDAWTAAVVGDELAAPGREALVAVDAHGLIAYAVTWTVGDVADLQRVVVAGRARRRGVASRLLHTLLARAASGGVRRMLLEVSEGNDAAVGCYQRLGFRELDRRRGYYRDGTDALVLQLDLADLPDSQEASR